VYSKAVYRVKKGADEDVDVDDEEAGAEGKVGSVRGGSGGSGPRFMAAIMDGIRENIEKLKERVKNTVLDMHRRANAAIVDAKQRAKDNVAVVALKYATTLVAEKMSLKMVKTLKSWGIENAGVVAFSNDVLTAILPNVGLVLEQALQCNRKRKDERLDECVEALDFTPITESFVANIVTEKRIPVIANIISFTVHILLNNTQVPVVCANAAFNPATWRTDGAVNLKKAVLLATRMAVDGDCRLDVDMLTCPN
jgi:hypothetical protein